MAAPLIDLTMSSQPQVCKPLGASVGKRRKAPNSQTSICKRKRESLLQITARCEWPGCANHLPERRLDSDMMPYTREEFVEEYAPVSGCTVRWDRAPAAATYCSVHVDARSTLLSELGFSKTSARRLSESGRLRLHPEMDAATCGALHTWLAESKTLYARAHPGMQPPSDTSLRIAHVFCCANKVVNFVGKNGTSIANRWTYNPLNLEGQMSKNRRLLTHGMPFDKLEAILDLDLQMSGMEVGSKHGRLFGEGLYVADSFMKSLQYAAPGSMNGKPVKALFLVEVNMGRPLFCTSADIQTSVRQYEEVAGGSTRQDITAARGQYYFSDSLLLESGWAKNCWIPRCPSADVSSFPCVITSSGQPHFRLRFNEWCVHNTQRYSLAYLLLLEEAPRERWPFARLLGGRGGCVIA
eukprot:TRINITY_DN47143_c0_g1_i1.p1 TRINITY_DN47143_c0_g1~~TRINITY_DN47143_c0_g1_i1.p1  ORF type:complete len:411 (+),score=28.76 TRINITY_DN47143_c0_g1_i1:49-1281(+)